MDVHLVVVEIAYVRRRNYMRIIGLYLEGGHILPELQKKENFSFVK